MIKLAIVGFFDFKASERSPAIAGSRGERRSDGAGERSRLRGCELSEVRDDVAKMKPVTAEVNGLGIDLGEVNPKQAMFLKSRALYTAYGGARGGGKSHAVRIKAVIGALKWPGIKILILRRTYGRRPRLGQRDRAQAAG